MDFSYAPLKEEDYFQLHKDGKEARIKYIGCIGIKESMRRLSHKARSKVATEAINRLCEVNSIDRKGIDKRRSDKIRGLLDDEPNLRYSGEDVQLSVTSTHLNVTLRDTQQIIIQHEMRNVSFVSSGDKDTVDFVAYVAKDANFGRACFVLDCGYDTVAEDLFHNIAQGFELRSKQILATLSRDGSSVNHHERMLSNYTDSTIPMTESHDNDNNNSYDQSYRLENENQHDNDIVSITRADLEKEPWYHGAYLTREQSETRLKQDGDFLVRESMLEEGKFVLSVMHENEKLHLLFDSIEQVRTKEKLFKSISQLVKYHHDENLPIVAEKRHVFLINGVPQPPKYPKY